MRRETFILMSVFVLLGAGFLFLQLKNKPLVDPDRTFHIEDKRRVHEVFITHRDGEQVKLSRKGKERGNICNKFLLLLYKVLEELV